MFVRRILWLSVRSRWLLGFCLFEVSFVKFKMSTSFSSPKQINYLNSVRFITFSTCLSLKLYHMPMLPFLVNLLKPSCFHHSQHFSQLFPPLPAPFEPGATVVRRSCWSSTCPTVPVEATRWARRWGPCSWGKRSCCWKLCRWELAQISAGK